MGCQREGAPKALWQLPPPAVPSAGLAAAMLARHARVALRVGGPPPPRNTSCPARPPPPPRANRAADLGPSYHESLIREAFLFLQERGHINFGALREPGAGGAEGAKGAAAAADAKADGDASGGEQEGGGGGGGGRGGPAERAGAGVQAVRRAAGRRHGGDD